MSPIRPKDRPGIGERGGLVWVGFRAAVAIPTRPPLLSPTPLAVGHLPRHKSRFPSLPFPSLPVPLFASPAPRSPRVPRFHLHARVVPPPRPPAGAHAADGVRCASYLSVSQAEAADGVPHVRLADRPRALADRREGMVTSIDNVRGLTLAISSSAFIGSSFVIKKIGLKKAGDSGVLEVSHTCMSHYGVILGEVANFAAYAFAPAVLVTPLGALSIIFRKMLVYIAICSTMGSLTVISVKAVAIALKLSFGGSNQFIYIQTWFFIVVVILNYLNKALDSFNTAVVSPVYYVMFTILTIFANMIMYKDSFSRNATQIATQLCGFVTIVAGTFLLHKTRDMGNEPPLPDDEICLDGGSVRPDRLSQSSS
uniref:Probable magnesium transporter n=1 Tax=Oryza meridionalis TaxID=40149 RepID=A0A0E0CKU9_9ORYZ